jgi:KDO2-lipid IV(A) lauroyltransferase
MKKRESPPIFSLKLLPARIMVFVLYMVSFLSLKNKQKLGAWLGVKAKRRLNSRAHIARTNLSACFPEKSEDEIELMVEESFKELVSGFIESTHAWWQDMEPYKNSVSVVGLEHIKKAQENGKGILLLGAHFAVVDFAIPLMSHHVTKVGYMYRPNDNPVIDHMIETGRDRSNCQSFTKRELREMRAFLADGGAVWYGCDQDFGKHATVFAPFFGVQAANITTPSWIAKKTGAAVIFMGMRRLDDGRHEISFSPELPFTGDDVLADTITWNQQLEKEIMRYPTQYMWVHKRFKTRPEGEPDFY